MRIKFSTFVLASAITAAAAFTATSAMAAPANASILHVPFSFTVAGKSLPAGDYRVDRQLQGKVIMLRAVDGGSTYSWIVNAASKPDDRVVARFGAQDHALQSIRYGNVITPQLAHKTKHVEDISPKYDAMR